VLPGAAWVKILAGFTLALGAILLVDGPQHEPGVPPPLQLLALVALAVSVFTVPVLYLVATRDLGMARGTAACAAGFALVIVVVKFVLAPSGVYEVNQRRAIESFLPFNEGLGPVVVAGMIGGLYAGAFALLYRVARDRVERAIGLRGPAGLRIRPLLILGGLLVMVPVAGFMAIIGYVGIPYLGFVFTSVAGTLIGVSLAGAATLAALSFRGEARRSIAAGDLAALVALFWLGLWFIVLYHVLWAIFVIVLGTIWPLRSVVPK
jgi:hypothetical protein